MEKFDHKKVWKEKQRQIRINQKIQNENKRTAEREHNRIKIDKQIEFEIKEIERLWKSTFPWYIFLPMILLIMKLFDMDSFTLKAFAYTCVLACIYTFISHNKITKGSILFKRYLSKKADIFYLVTINSGIILSLFIGISVYYKYYWINIILSVFNMIIYFILAMYFSMVFNAYKSYKANHNF